MSIQPPQGILNIPNATLRVGKLEVNSTEGLDTVLNNIERNTILLEDTTEYPTTGDPVETEKRWGLKVPNIFVATFEIKGVGSSFNFRNNSNGDAKVGYTLTFSGTTLTLKYNNASLTTATIPNLNAAYGKVYLTYEKQYFTVTVDGTRVLTYKDDVTRTPPEGEYANFFTGTGGGFKNLKVVAGHLISDGTSNVSLYGGLAVTSNLEVGQANLFVDTVSGRVGVGTINPTSNLHVIGEIISDGVRTNSVDETDIEIKTPFNIDVNIIGTWLNADNPGNIDIDGNGYVTKIWDETSKGNDFTVPSPRNVTYNTSKRMIHFNGSEAGINHMEAPIPASVIASADTPYCFTAVVERDSTTDDLDLIANLFNSDNEFNSDDNSTYTRHNIYATNTRRHINANKVTDTLINRERVLRKFIITANCSGGENSLYVNGIFAGSTTDITSARNEAILRIGSDSDPNNTYTMKAWLGEAIFFTRNLTDTELDNLHRYLNVKWDVYKKPVFDIFTAAGQSNMAGRAGNASATAKPDYGREFDPQYWIPTKTPLKLIRDPIGGNGANDTSIGSCLPAFCEEYYNQTGRECVILYTAKGGSSIFNQNEWDVDYSTTNYVADTINILNKAEIALREMGFEVNNKNILWHQGESDQDRTTANYKAKFLELHDYWIANGYDNVFYYEISRTSTNDFQNPRTAQREMWKERETLHLIFSCAKFYDQGKFSDSIHYSPAGYDEMGREGAKSVAKVLSSNKNAIIQKVLDVIPTKNSYVSGINLPFGTTNERPTNPKTGSFRYNTTFSDLEYFNGQYWLTVSSRDGLTEATAATSASEVKASLGNPADGLYYLKLPGMSIPEQFYIYFDKEFAAEGEHNYIILSNFGRDGGGVFTTSNWTNTGTMTTTTPRTSTTLYSRLYLLENALPKIDGKYYIWLQNKLEVPDPDFPWIEWVSAQQANPYDAKLTSTNVAGKEELYRTAGISSWGEFGGYHNQSVNYNTAGGKISGSIALGNWYWNAALTTYWGDNIPVSAGTVTYTYNGTEYDITGQTAESRHNIFAVAN